MWGIFESPQITKKTEEEKINFDSMDSRIKACSFGKFTKEQMKIELERINFLNHPLMSSMSAGVTSPGSQSI